MSANLCINIKSGVNSIQKEIDLYSAEEWTTETEQQLMTRVRDIITTLRVFSNSFSLVLTIDVSDFNSALFVLNKKISRPLEINHQKLTIREIEILGLIMQGFTNKEIAEKLFISYETVKSHRKHILEKTGTKNTAALINYYHQTFFEK